MPTSISKRRASNVWLPAPDLRAFVYIVAPLAALLIALILLRHGFGLSASEYNAAFADWPTP